MTAYEYILNMGRFFLVTVGVLSLEMGSFPVLVYVCSSCYVCSISSWKLVDTHPSIYHTCSSLSLEV